MEGGNEALPLRAQLFAGGAAGLIADSIAHPLDTIRARIVMKSKVGRYHYAGLFDAIRTIGRSEGLRGFYRGFGAVCAGTIPGHALYFMVYELSKRHLGRLLHISNPDHFALTVGCGVLADFAGAVTWVPMEVVKQRAMIYTELTQFQIVRNVLRNEGPAGMYQGFMAGIYTFAPYVCLNFAFYEKFKSLWSKYLERDREQLPMSCYFTAAISSSYLSSLLTTPLCVGRTRIQVLEGKRGVNLFSEIASIIREEGWYSLIEVWKARALWFAVGTATSFVAYEGFKRLVRPSKLTTKPRIEPL